MSEINVKVRLGAQTLYDTKVYVEIEEPVSLLKKKICEKDENLNQTLIVVVYCGSVMEDCNPIYMYDVLEGSTVHVFKKIQHEKAPPPKSLADADLMKLGVAFRSLSLNSSYRGALMRLSKPEVINNIILTTPGLNKDPVALTLLQHSELLVKLSDFEVVKRISESHPALASAALQVAAAVHEEVLQNHHIATDMLNRPMFNNGSDEDIEDLDDSSPASEASSSQPVSRNSSFGTITAAQLASAIASVTTQQPQPSTSGASTSTGNLTNVPESISTVYQHRPNDIDLPTQLQIMRDMGLNNDAVNIEALRISNDLETAIELVLSGFSTTDNNRV